VRSTTCDCNRELRCGNRNRATVVVVSHARQTLCAGMNQKSAARTRPSPCADAGEARTEDHKRLKPDMRGADDTHRLCVRDTEPLQLGSQSRVEPTEFRFSTCGGGESITPLVPQKRVSAESPVDVRQKPTGQPFYRWKTKCGGFAVSENAATEAGRGRESVTEAGRWLLTGVTFER
jgi:hypothetical protein